MAATRLQRTPTEQAQCSITDTLESLAAAEQDADRLTPEQAFDVGCALKDAREALDRALALIAQAQPQVQRLAA